MKKLLLALFLCLAPVLAQAQVPYFSGPQDPALLFYYLNQLVANLNNGLASSPVLLQVTPATGATQTLSGQANIALQLTPAGTIANDTVVFPSNARQGQTVTIFSSAIITTLTLTAGSGQTIVGGVSTLGAAG